MKFLVLGCNGMAGHMISLYLKEKGHGVVGFARERSKYVDTKIGDARDLEHMKSIIFSGRFDTVINCIGLLNRSAEKDHEAAVFLNAYLPHYLAKITSGTAVQIINMSTDCVFSGNAGGYKESDFPDGTMFYDRSKALGEVIDNENVTFRNSVVGPDIKKSGIGLLNWFMQQKGKVIGYRNAIWTGQTTLQLAKTMERAAIHRAYGLYNMVPESRISKFELLTLFNQYLKKNIVEIVPEDDFKIDKSLKRTNYERFNLKIPSYEEQIKELGDWMRIHKEMYPHYDL